jgi:hypothetical protein
MQNARKQKKKKQLKAQEHHENLAALSPLDQSEEDKQTDNKEIIITQNIDGSSIQEKEQKNPEPSPIGIASTRINASAVASKGQSKHDLAECFHCKEKDVVICELRQGLSKQTTSITANQMYPHETKFTIPKQKYSDLQEAMQRSRNSVTVVFDKSGVLEHVIDDI